MVKACSFKRKIKDSEVIPNEWPVLAGVRRFRVQQLLARSIWRCVVEMILSGKQNLADERLALDI